MNFVIFHAKFVLHVPKVFRETSTVKFLETSTIKFLERQVLLIYLEGNLGNLPKWDKGNLQGNLGNLRKWNKGKLQGNLGNLRKWDKGNLGNLHCTCVNCTCVSLSKN